MARGCLYMSNKTRGIKHVLLEAWHSARVCGHVFEPFRTLMRMLAACMRKARQELLRSKDVLVDTVLQRSMCGHLLLFGKCLDGLYSGNDTKRHL